MATEQDPTEATHDGTEDERLTRVEDKLDALADQVSRLLPASHGEAEQKTERRLDRPSAAEERAVSIEEQVQAELDKRDRQAREQADADRKAREAESTQARLARLEETPPAPPRSRRTVLLGWGDGRDARR